MKAKYKHYGNECVIYNQVICEDNVVVEIESYIISWADDTPQTETTLCGDEKEAVALYNKLCKALEGRGYTCEYKD